MSVSIYLARIFSVYLLLVGLSMLINRGFFRAAAKEIASNNVAMLIIATTTLILGLLLVNLHNIWVNDWRVAVTVFCWFVMVSGVIRTLLPTFVQGMAGRIAYKNGPFLRVASILSILAGVMYGYLGFFSVHAH